MSQNRPSFTSLSVGKRKMSRNLCFRSDLSDIVTRPCVYPRVNVTLTLARCIAHLGIYVQFCVGIFNKKSKVCGGGTKNAKLRHRSDRTQMIVSYVQHPWQKGESRRFQAKQENWLRICVLLKTRAVFELLCGYQGTQNQTKHSFEKLMTCVILWKKIVLMFSFLNFLS